MAIIFPGEEERAEAPPWFLEYIAELSRSTRTIHAVYVGFLVYCALTIFGASDKRILLDEAVHLPIINLDVPFSAFVLIAPIVGVVNFIYLQTHLQVIRGAIKELRANYERPEKGRLYPWMINMAEEPEPGVVGKIQKMLVDLSLWWLLPITLFLFILLTLKKHDTFLTVYEWVISCAGTFIVLWFWHRYEDLTQDSAPPPKAAFDRLLAITVKHFRIVRLGGAMLLAYILVLAMMLADQEGEPGYLGLKLSGEVLSKEQKEEYGTFWVDLRGVNLRNAMLDSAFLKRANLVGSGLGGANLASANLEGADLRYADLTGANLNCAKLKGADLRGALLSGAFIINADLSKVQLDPEQRSQAVVLDTNEAPDSEMVNQKPGDRVRSAKEVWESYPAENQRVELTLSEFKVARSFDSEGKYYVKKGMFLGSAPPGRDVLADEIFLLYQEGEQKIARVRLIHSIDSPPEDPNSQVANSRARYLDVIYLSRKMTFLCKERESVER